MTNRDRTLNILHGKPADRMPAVHFGYWRELLLDWAEQGYIPKRIAENCGPGNSTERELDKLIGWDFNWVQLYYADIRLHPRFEGKLLEVLPDGSQRVLNGNGIIQRVKPGVVSIPAEDDYLLKDREAFETLFLPKMKFTPDRLNEKFFKNFNETRDKDIPAVLFLGSLLGDIRDITSVAGMGYLLHDDDEQLFADIVDTYAEMQYACAEAVLATGAKFDIAHFWEDICFNHGSLIAPETVRKLCLKHYKKRCDLCHRYGIDIISLDCDGVISQLAPIWHEAGINTMFPLEVGTWGDQFESLRKNIGPGLLGVGGMRKIVLTQDRDAVDQELKRLQRLVSLGGFIPCPDHLLMPGVKFELVQYYAEKVKELKV